MKLSSIVLFVICAALFAVTSTYAAEPDEPTWESLSRNPIPEWLKDDEFGVYTHWGVYSVPAHGGRSLLPQIRSGGKTERTLCWNYQKYSAVRKGKWEAVRRSNNRLKPDGAWQLYELSRDRSETSDVSSSYPEVVETLARVWDDWRRDIGPLHKERI